MKGIAAKIVTLVNLLREGAIGTALHLLRQQLWSDQEAYGLRRDLTAPFTPPNAKLPVTGVRPLHPDDVTALLDVGAQPSAADVEGVRTQQRLIDANIATCYVAVTDLGQPCYMQWLIAPGENAKVHRFFHGLFAPLAPDEVLLEGAYVPPRFRGQRINSRAMAVLAERGADLGARWAITFIGVDNIPSIRGAKGAGFEPFLLRHERWRFFRRGITFAPLPDDAEKRSDPA